MQLHDFMVSCVGFVCITISVDLSIPWWERERVRARDGERERQSRTYCYARTHNRNGILFVWSIKSLSLLSFIPSHSIRLAHIFVALNTKRSGLERRKCQWSEFCLTCSLFLFQKCPLKQQVTDLGCVLCCVAQSAEVRFVRRLFWWQCKVRQRERESERDTGLTPKSNWKPCKILWFVCYSLSLSRLFISQWQFCR